TVSGMPENEPLPGVSVVLKGTTLGIVTDGTGRYTISLPDKSGVLVFSFVGYASQEVPVSDQTTIDIGLIQDVTSLSEVVIVGYGTVKKSLVSGAITTVPLANIQPVATQRVDQMLQGRAPGVLVLNTDGAPGGN